MQLKGQSGIIAVDTLLQQTVADSTLKSSKKVYLRNNQVTFQTDLADCISDAPEV